MVGTSKYLEWLAKVKNINSLPSQKRNYPRNKLKQAIASYSSEELASYVYHGLGHVADVSNQLWAADSFIDQVTSKNTKMKTTLEWLIATAKQAAAQSLPPRPSFKTQSSKNQLGRRLPGSEGITAQYKLYQPDSLQSLALQKISSCYTPQCPAPEAPVPQPPVFDVSQIIIENPRTVKDFSLLTDDELEVQIIKHLKIKPEKSRSLGEYFEDGELPVVKLEPPSPVKSEPDSVEPSEFDLSVQPIKTETCDSSPTSAQPGTLTSPDIIPVSPPRMGKTPSPRLIGPGSGVRELWTKSEIVASLSNTLADFKAMANRGKDIHRVENLLLQEVEDQVHNIIKKRPHSKVKSGGSHRHDRQSPPGGYYQPREVRHFPYNYPPPRINTRDPRSEYYQNRFSRR